MKIRSIKTKLILTIVIIVTVTIVPIAYLSITESSEIIERNTISSSEMEMKMIGENVEELFRIIENTTMTIILNKEIREILSKTDQEQTMEWRNVLSQGQAYLLDVVRSNPIIADINIVQENYVLGANTRYSSNANLSELDWYQKTIQAQYGIWRGVSQGFGDKTTDVISYSRNIIDFNAKNKTLGVINVELHYDMILKRLAKAQSVQNHFYVIDSFGADVIRPVDAVVVFLEANLEKEELPSALEKEEVLLDETILLQIAERNEPENIVGDEAFFYGKMHGNNALIIHTQVSGTDWTMVSVYPLRQLLSEVSDLRQKTIINSAIGLLLASAVGYYLSTRLTNSIRSLQKIMEKVESGDLSVRISTDTNDEVGRLGRGFNRMIEQLSFIVSNVKAVSTTIHETNQQMFDNSTYVQHASTEISRAIEEVAAGASHQAHDTMEGVELSTVLSEGIQRVIEEIAQVKEETEFARLNSINGHSTVQNLSHISKQSTENLGRVINEIQELDEESEKVTHIVEVIMDISKRTNLLALNASIEAARAGEAGKGFAVVADEIRKLAEQVRLASNDVSDIIFQTRERMSHVANQTDLVNELNKEQGSTVLQTEDAFNQIIHCVQGISGRIDILSQYTAVMEQQRAEIIEKMQSISAVSEQSAASCEEVASSMLTQEESIVQLAQYIRKSNDQLDELLNNIAAFKL